MSFDGFFLHHMVEELRRELVNGRIQKINQPFEQELVLQIRSNRQSHRLLLSAHPVFGRIQLTQTTFENPAQPSTFIMVLRKYLQGALIESIEQVENDRIVEMTVSNKNEIGDHIQATLIIEIMGKHSNILLVDKSSHKILEVIKHVGFSQNSYRTLLPGSTYIAPPSMESLNPFTIKDEKLFEILQTQGTTAKNLQSLFQGLGRDTANELENILASDKLSTFRSFFSQETKPCLTETSFSPVPFANQVREPFANQVREPFASLSDLLDTYYKDKAERDRVKQQASELIRRVENELQKNRHKLKKQEKELLATDNAEEFRQKGELLTTFLHQVPNDQDQVILDNYYTNQPITIALDKALTPNQNAQRYFKRYQKLKEAVKYLTDLIEETKATILYLESVETVLNQAGLEEIAEIREELIQTGFIRRRQREKIQKRKKPEQYLASDGKTIIYVGRNNLQNEELTFKMARKEELWFHAKDIPGSHVVISGNLDPSDEVKTDAADLPSSFSQGRLSNLVQVDMIEVKKLNKPTGGKPGFVTYAGQKTLRVTPDPEKIASMKKS